VKVDGDFHRERAGASLMLMLMPPMQLISSTATHIAALTPG
jgi:hypothetical protein